MLEKDKGGTERRFSEEKKSVDEERRYAGKSHGIKMGNYAVLYKGRWRDREQEEQRKEKNNWDEERKMRDERDKGLTEKRRLRKKEIEGETDGKNVGLGFLSLMSNNSPLLHYT